MARSGWSDAWPSASRVTRSVKRSICASMARYLASIPVASLAFFAIANASSVALSYCGLAAAGSRARSTPVVARSMAAGSAARSSVKDWRTPSPRPILKTAKTDPFGNERCASSSAAARAFLAASGPSWSKTRATTLVSASPALAAAAAGAAAAFGVPAGSAERADPSACTRRNDSIAQGLPSSRTWISSARRSSTSRPDLSRTTRSRRTTSLRAGKTGGDTGSWEPPRDADDRRRRATHAGCSLMIDEPPSQCVVRTARDRYPCTVRSSVAPHRVAGQLARHRLPGRASALGRVRAVRGYDTAGRHGLPSRGVTAPPRRSARRRRRRHSACLDSRRTRAPCSRSV